MGYLFYVSGKYIKPGVVVTSIICCVFLYFWGYEMWSYKLIYGTYTGNMHNNTEMPEFKFTDINGTTIRRQDFAGRYTVLDFWTTSCGVCFQKFPLFEEQYVKYRSNNNVVLYSINAKLPSDKEGVSFEIINEIGYSFPTLQGGLIEEVKSTFGIWAYPTVIVFNPQGFMIFRGDMDKAFTFVERELERDFTD
jgi:thiol-disulfide isomerase/thioredoxin